MAFVKSINAAEEKKSKNVRHNQKVDKIQRVAKREYLRKVGRLPAEELEPTFKKRKR